MSSKFCPKCGKKETKDNKLVTSICMECFSKENPLLKEYKENKIVICSKCNSYMDQNKWYPKFSIDNETNIKKIIKCLLPQRLKFSNMSKIEKIEVTPNLSKDSQFKYGIIENKVVIFGAIQDVESKDEYTLPIRVERSICNLCKRKNSNYFEAIIQIRPRDERLLDFIKNDINENSKVFITKFEEKKHGYDLYITAKEYLKNILSKVKSEFEIESKISRTLFGRKEGKEVYRITLLLRLKE